MQIRKATTKDVPGLLPLIASYWSFEGIRGFDASRVAGVLEDLLASDSKGDGWVATADGEIVGYLIAVYVMSLEHLGITAEVDEMFVVSRARRKNAGSALLREAESEFARRGCTNVSLQLARENEAARVFYHRHHYSDRSRYELLDKELDASGFCKKQID